MILLQVVQFQVLAEILHFPKQHLKLEINKVSNPVKSTRGSYLLKVTDRTEIDSTLYSIQKNSLRDNLLTQKRSRVFADWIEGLKEEAEIEDNRHIFYR